MYMSKYIYKHIWGPSRETVLDRIKEQIGQPSKDALQRSLSTPSHIATHPPPDNPDIKTGRPLERHACRVVPPFGLRANPKP